MELQVELRVVALRVELKMQLEIKLTFGSLS
jgi:hypothetical protein